MPTREPPSKSDARPFDGDRFAHQLSAPRGRLQEAMPRNTPPHASRQQPSHPQSQWDDSDWIRIRMMPPVSRRVVCCRGAPAAFTPSVIVLADFGMGLARKLGQTHHRRSGVDPGRDRCLLRRPVAAPRRRTDQSRYGDAVACVRDRRQYPGRATPSRSGAPRSSGSAASGWPCESAISSCATAIMSSSHQRLRRKSNCPAWL